MKKHEGSPEIPPGEDNLEPDQPAVEVLLSVDPEFLGNLTPEAQILFRDGNEWSSRQQIALAALRDQYANRGLAQRAERPSSEDDTD